MTIIVQNSSEGTEYKSKGTTRIVASAAEATKIFQMRKALRRATMCSVSRPASCHPACQQLNQKLLQTSIITLQPSKTIEPKVVLGFAISGRQPAASILDSRGIQSDTERPENVTKKFPSPPKVEHEDIKNDAAAPM